MGMTSPITSRMTSSRLRLPGCWRPPARPAEIHSSNSPGRMIRRPSPGPSNMISSIWRWMEGGNTSSSTGPEGAAGGPLGGPIWGPYRGPIRGLLCGVSAGGGLSSPPKFSRDPRGLQLSLILAQKRRARGFRRGPSPKKFPGKNLEANWPPIYCA